MPYSYIKNIGIKEKKYKKDYGTGGRIGMLNYLFLLSFLIYLLVKECKKDSKVYVDCNADILARNAQVIRENREILRLNKEIRLLIKK